ncbi:MAG: response regulator transcription factor [Tissierellales bacterium]|jgi:DNA-binding response OmpR family regulator|nr:response regulator transcription factor [Tissierellales bacterium]
MNTNILIVEDEVKIARFLELELNHEGYCITTVFNGRDGLEQGLSNQYDMILLDVMLPGLNGMEICRRIRQKSDIPIIMLTAKDDTMDKVMGLDFGADDYVTKPFEIEELLARIRRTLRHIKTLDSDSQSSKLLCRNLSLDDSRHIVTYNNSEIQLTKKEYDLLQYLMINKNMALSRDQILENVWGFDFVGQTNIVDVYIRYLRSKIDDVFHVKLIETIRGVGYIMKDSNK